MNDAAQRLAEARTYLRMLTTGAPSDGLLEVRYRSAHGGMRRFFSAVGQLDVAADRIVRLGELTDVYVGCVIRAREAGTRGDLLPARVLWTDCDSPTSLHALRAVDPSPSMIVASGTLGHAHAFWPLTRAVPASVLEDANRRLARVLRADLKCADAPRILRPAGTFNFKGGERRPVRLLCAHETRHDPDELIGRLPPEQQRPDQGDVKRSSRDLDPLQGIAPAHYVRLLTGRTPGHDGKIACPFHDDGTPSFHVYPTPEQGWVCYGCHTPDGKPLGGDIYTLASLLWSIPANGASFRDLRARLKDVFGHDRHHHRANEGSLWPER